MAKERAQFQMVLPRLDVPIRLPRIEPEVPLPPAEEARRRPEPPMKRFVWSKYEDSGFPSRVNHATAHCRGSDGCDYVYSIGGFHSSDDERAKRAAQESSPYFKTGPIDVYKLDVATRKWNKVNVIRTTRNKEIPIRGGEPPRRYGHTCVSYEGKIFMFGGRNDDDGSFKVMECFDTERSMWMKVHVTADGCALPRSRDGHACCTLGKDMYMHGGFDTGSLVFTGDLYVFDMDLHTWKLLPDKGDRMSQRDFHSTVCLNDRIVVFGGRSDQNAPQFSNQDIYDAYFYEYNLEKQEWKMIETKGYRPLGRRSLSAMKYDENKVLYFGGFNARLNRHFNDIFIYDSTTNHITEVVPFGIPPTPRRRCGHARVGTELAFCGGTSPIEKFINGEKRLILHDHSDMYILSLVPTLEQLAMMVVKECHLSTAILPVHIRRERFLA